MKFLEFLPLIVFFILCKTHDIIVATGGLVVVTILSTAFIYVKTKKIPKMHLFSVIIIVIFGIMTVLLKDPIFIKLKLTIVNLIFALILLYGYITKKPLMKMMIGDGAKKMNLRDGDWLIMNISWGIFFLILAIFNEIIWRNFSEEIWVNFKVFGVMGLTLIFTILQMVFYSKKTKVNNGA